ncbi:MAG: DNA methyltransferase [Acidimicrobiales bacterium]
MTAPTPRTRPKSTQAALTVPLAIWPVAQTTAQWQRAGRYLPAVTAHPGKMLPELARCIVTEYSSPGALVVDPLAGIGTTIVEAALLGAVLVAEAVGGLPRWCCRRNAWRTTRRSARAPRPSPPRSRLLAMRPGSAAVRTSSVVLLVGRQGVCAELGMVVLGLVLRGIGTWRGGVLRSLLASNRRVRPSPTRLVSRRRRCRRWPHRRWSRTLQR